MLKESSEVVKPGCEEDLGTESTSKILVFFFFLSVLSHVVYCAGREYRILEISN